MPPDLHARGQFLILDRKGFVGKFEAADFFDDGEVLVDPVDCFPHRGLERRVGLQLDEIIGHALFA